MRNIALKLMYNGTAYHGWQVQKNAVTVCETLQKALEKITGAPVHLTGCGRTDAGVPVSYTHLDVYKRQAAGQLRRAGGGAGTEIRP